MKLSFHPAQHGYHFANTFVNRPIGGLPITTYGLCGGMVMSALDYWRAGVPIPTHIANDFGPDGVPAEGSRMRTYIYDRQMNSLLTKMMWTRWITAPWITPSDFHSWAIGSEFDIVRKELDRGRPTMIGLWSMQKGAATSGHQVLCYGYEVNPKRFYIYDPNHPDQECELVPVSAAAGCEVRIGGLKKDTYRGYFITDVYNWGEPALMPRYFDIGILTSMSTNPSGTNVPIGGPMQCSVQVQNFGEYKANFKNLFIFVRGPQGQNLDSLLGGAEPGLTTLHPGVKKLIVRNCNAFGNLPGNHVVGISYLSKQNNWHIITAGAPFTTAQTQVTLQAQVKQVVNKTITIRESDFEVDTGVILQPGDDFELTANGQIWAGVWFTGNNGPEGWTDRIETNPRSPYINRPDAYPFSLLGRFQGQSYFYIGRGMSRKKFTGSSALRLYMRINDDTPGNGTGTFQCRVSVWR